MVKYAEDYFFGVVSFCACWRVWQNLNFMFSNPFLGKLSHKAWGSFLLKHKISRWTWEKLIFKDILVFVCVNFAFNKVSSSNSLSDIQPDIMIPCGNSTVLFKAVLTKCLCYFPGSYPHRQFAFLATDYFAPVIFGTRNLWCGPNVPISFLSFRKQWFFVGL